VLTANIVGCIKIIVKKRSAFKVGDAVELKSGGPRMTVTDAQSADKLRCSWFVGTKLHSALLPPQALKVPKADEMEKVRNVWTELAYPESKAQPPALPESPP
jgi:uncharacterized protein YodC (DUF2158 family)